MINKIEKYDEHWHEEDDLGAARGMFGWPLIVGCIFTALAVCAGSYWLDHSF